MSISTNNFNRPYGYPEILSHLASSLSKRHREIESEFKMINLKLEGQLEKFICALEQILEMGSANAFDIQDLNNIITLIRNTSSDQLPYCADRISYLAQEILKPIPVSQPPNIVPFISDLWGIISNYAFAPHEMPYVTKTLQAWGWTELTLPIPTATVWDVIFQYLGLERANVPFPIYEGLLKLGDDEVLTNYSKIYHAEISPQYSEGLAEISDRIQRFHDQKAFSRLIDLNYDLKNSKDPLCDEYWLQRRRLSTRMPSLFVSNVNSNEEEFGATFFGPVLYREILNYKGKNLNYPSILTLSPYLQSLDLSDSLMNLPIEMFLEHYRFLRNIRLRDYSFNQVQFKDNNFLESISFNFQYLTNKILTPTLKTKNNFQVYIKNLTRLKRINIRNVNGNVCLDAINCHALEEMYLTGYYGPSRIKLRGVPSLTKIYISANCESTDIDNCPNLHTLVIFFKNKQQDLKAYFNINTSSITCLKLENSETSYNISESLLQVILKQKRITFLELRHFQNLPDNFISRIAPQLTSISIFKVDPLLLWKLNKNCTTITSQFQSPFKDSPDNFKIWSIIQSYIQKQEEVNLMDGLIPSLFEFFKKYGMIMELFNIFYNLINREYNYFSSITFGNRKLKSEN